ncbi:MAG: 6-bladed beta-propeller [Bryobacteraceae bacterium]
MMLRRYFAISSVLLLVVTVAAAGPKKKAASQQTLKLGDQRTTGYFDINKIVWPNPPEVARIRFVELFTGEKVDHAKDGEKKKPKKQSWMDRLAGTESADQIDITKLPLQLIRTCGLAVDSKGLIYAADQGVGAIFIWDPVTGAVKTIRNGREAHFGLINGLAVDDNDRLFVGDIKLNRVLVLNSKHQPEATIGAGELLTPGGLAIDTENRQLYVVDTGNDVVRVYDADTFKPLRVLGTPGKKHTLTDPGNFSLPTNVAVDSEGDVYITDTFNNRVQIFDGDGNFVSMFGKHGDGVGQFERPKGIAVDCDRHIWVVDAAQDRVKVYDREGRLLIYFGEHGEYPGRFMGAYGITIDNKNRVLVSETFPGRVQMFRYVTDAEADQARSEQAQARTRPAQPPGKK